MRSRAVDAIEEAVDLRAQLALAVRMVAVAAQLDGDAVGHRDLPPARVRAVVVARPVDHGRVAHDPHARGARRPRRCRFRLERADVAWRRATTRLATVLAAAVGGRFPAADGRVEVLPTDDHGTSAVVAMTGHAYVLADVDRHELSGSLRTAPADSAARCIPTCCAGWPGVTGRSARSTSCSRHAASAARRRRRRRSMASPRRAPSASPGRCATAGTWRWSVEPDGVVVLGRGLVGRRELSVELFDPSAVSTGAGRRLIAAGLRVRPGGRVVLGPGRRRQRPLAARLPGVRLHPDRLRGVDHLTRSECLRHRSVPSGHRARGTPMTARVGRRGRWASDRGDCPRCGRTVEQRFYGPCDDCRSALRDAFRVEGRVIELAEYEPKMNVTPNAVATKDD